MRQRCDICILLIINDYLIINCYWLSKMYEICNPTINFVTSVVCSLNVVFYIHYDGGAIQNTFYSCITHYFSFPSFVQICVEKDIQSLTRN